jgi:AAA domain
MGQRARQKCYEPWLSSAGARRNDRGLRVGAGKKPVTADGVRTVTGRSVRWQRSTGGEILIGTAARWLCVDPTLAGADVLLVDEAWQCAYADLGALGALARQVICVGDPGQVAPVVTGSTQRWAGQKAGLSRCSED